MTRDRIIGILYLSLTLMFFYTGVKLKLQDNIQTEPYILFVYIFGTYSLFCGMYYLIFKNDD